MSFVKCPCCAGHEAIGADTAAALAEAIYSYVGRGELSAETVCELDNIRNAVLNEQDRRFGQPHYGHDEQPPLCPTPAKRKYPSKATARNTWQQHAYKCECGFWHLSKQTPEEHFAKVNSPPATAGEFDAIDPLLT